jgi:hypothetical protein
VTSDRTSEARLLELIGAVEGGVYRSSPKSGYSPVFALIRYALQTLHSALSHGGLEAIREWCSGESFS